MLVRPKPRCNLQAHNVTIEEGLHFRKIAVNSVFGVESVKSGSIATVNDIINEVAVEDRCFGRLLADRVLDDGNFSRYCFLLLIESSYVAGSHVVTELMFDTLHCHRTATNTKKVTFIPLYGAILKPREDKNHRVDRPRISPNKLG